MQATNKAKMNVMLVPMYQLLLLLVMIIPVTSRLNSVQEIKFTRPRKAKDGPPLCALDQADETTSASSLKDCSLKCARDGGCAGFNIKNSLTCDHINTPVLASASRTHSPVMCTIINQRSPHLCRTACFTR